MWTLAHAHGVLLSLVNVGFALTLKVVGGEGNSWLGRASMLLIVATLLLPGGFFLGGVTIHNGDPGVGILLVPVGAFVLLAAVAIVAKNVAVEG